MHWAEIWPQVLGAVVVSICSAMVTRIVQKIARTLENVATKDFVTKSLEVHGKKLMTDIGNLFVTVSAQQIVNSDIEARLRRIEDAYSVKLVTLVSTDKPLAKS